MCNLFRLTGSLRVEYVYFVRLLLEIGLSLECNGEPAFKLLVTVHHSSDNFVPTLIQVESKKGRVHKMPVWFGSSQDALGEGLL